MNTSSVKALAEQLSDSLHSIKIQNSEETRIVFKDDAPTALRDWLINVMSRDDNELFADMDDYYNAAYQLSDILEYAGDDEDSQDSAVYETEWVDIYNADLLNWVKGNLYRISDVDDALSGGADGLIGAITMAQQRVREGYALNILGAIRKAVRGEE